MGSRGQDRGKALGKGSGENITIVNETDVWTYRHREDNEPFVDAINTAARTISDDFSGLMDMPRAMMIWNVYRSRLIGQIMGDAGIKVIPTLQFADSESFKFCFDGILPGGVVATSNVGAVKDPDATKVFVEGMDEAIKRIKPEKILCYGVPMEDYDFQGVEVKFYEPTSKPGRWD